MKRSRFCLGLKLCLASVVVPGLVTHAPAAPLLQGGFEVDTSSSLAVNLTPVTSSGIAVGDVNGGDYTPNLPDPDPRANGILLGTVAENGRDRNDGNGVRYPTVSIGTDPAFGGGQHFLAVSAAGTANLEHDVDLAFAWFPYDTFLGGVATNSVNNGPITALTASPGIDLGPGEEFVDHGDGTYTLDLTAPAFAADSQTGLLLVNGARNEGNYALSRSNPDGTFTIFCHDNNADATTYEPDPVAFVYLPAQTSSQVVALARVRGDASSEVSAGSFTLTHAGTGTWQLTIPGHSPATGTLLLSPEGGGSSNVDNIVSHQWDGIADHWIIQSRDLPSLVLQDLAAAEPAFSFAFLTRSPIFVDAAATGAGDGSSWADAFPALRDALARATAHDTFWIAAGTYTPAAPGDRGASFAPRSGQRLFGGFPAGGGDGTFAARDSQAHPTILSGDLARDDGPALFQNDGENSFHVLDSSLASTGALLDGLTITGGHADGAGPDANGGALAGDRGLNFQRCRFLANRADGNGGAVQAFSVNHRFLHCVFEANQAGLDGGAVHDDDNATTFTNCLFTGNRAGQHGGAVFHRQAGTAHLHNTFQGNDAGGEGGALYFELPSGLTLTNCLLWNNRAGGSTSTPSASFFNNGGTPAFAHCLVEHHAPAGPGNLDGTDPANDPLFVSPLDPATAPAPGGDQRLEGASPAIRTGDASALPAELAEDLDGNPRLVPLGPDLGVYEWQQLSNFRVSNRLLPVGAGSERVLPGWGSNTSAFNGGAGFTYQFVLTGATGDLAFDVLPSVDPDGTLRLTPTAGTQGTATFSVVLTDPGAAFADSAARDVTLTVLPVLFVNATANGANDGTSWADAFVHLQDALAAALSGHEIWVAAGAYRPDRGANQTLGDRGATFTMKNEVALYGGFIGSESALAQRPADPAANPAILSGDLLGDDGPAFANDAENSLHVLTAPSSVTGTARLDGFTVTGGHANGGQTDNDGAGLFCRGNASLVIVHCRFLANRAPVLGSGSGGAIFADGTGSTLAVSDCVFAENRGGSQGGAVWVAGTASFLRCRFEGNSSTRKGGAVFVSSNASSFSRCDFVGNLGRDGGAVCHVVLSTATYRDCCFEGNSASSRGGAIVNFGAEPRFTRCQFEGNSAQDGGAIHNERSPTLPRSRPVLIDCILQGNAATGDGGAIANFRSVPTLTNCTLQGNSAGGDGGALFNLGRPSDLTNCLIWNNRASGVTNTPSASVLDSAGNTYSHCLVQNLHLFDTNLDGTDPANDPRFIAPLDPALAPQTGGDLRLLAGSPVLDLGDNAANSEPLDLAGAPRIQNGTIDLGAFEGAFVTFAHLHPALDPNADANANGLTNYHDYAAGFDPTVSVSPALVTPVIDRDLRLTLRQRNNAADLVATWEKSATLLPESWSLLIESTDFTLDSVTSNGPRDTFTLQLLFDPALDPRMFFRQTFRSTP